MKSNFNIPQSKSDKVKLLNAIRKGERTINGPKEPPGYDVTLWKEDPDRPGFMHTFSNGPGGDGVGASISNTEFEAQRIASPKGWITLDLN